MKRSEMADYLKQEMWVERATETIAQWENLQGVMVPDEAKNSIIKFMRGKIKKGIQKNTLTKVFMQIAVTALVYIKMKGKY